VKNHDFTPKNHIFPILGEVREIFGVFHVKNHDFTPKKSYFFPILGGARAGCAPPLNPPLRWSDKCFKLMKVLKNNLAKDDIFVISGYGPIIFIRPSKYGLIMAYRCSSVHLRLVR
jgi:hypothetical protein